MKKAILSLILLSLLPLYVFSARRALLVGIDRYVMNNTYGGRLDLKGCANDVLDLKKILVEKFDFLEDEIRVILDQKATRSSILEGFQWLVKGARPQDWIFFSFSGHGTQVPDLNGDEEDGKDECICPTDVEPVQRLNVITDDEINEFIKQLKDKRAFFLFDSCHSGTMKRGSLPKTEGLQDAAYFARLLPPPALLEEESQFRSQKDYKYYAEPAAVIGQGVDFARAEGELVVFSAAAPYQVAVPININTDHPNGAMTYSVLRGLEGAADRNRDNTITYRELLEFSREFVNKSISREYAKVIRLEQEPQIDTEPEKIENSIFFLTPQAELSSLINTYSTFNISLRLLGRNLRKVRLKEFVEYEIKSDKSGYLYLFAISPDGEVTCLLPNRIFKETNYVEKGEVTVIPPQDANFKIEAVEPLGKVRTLAIVTTKPLDLERFCGAREEELLHTLGSDELKELVRSTRGITRTLSPAEWAAKVIELEIVK